MDAVRQIVEESCNIVLLGAGASCATCPEDKNGKTLPLMDNLAKTVGIEEDLKSCGGEPDQNFEEIDIEDDGKRNSIHKKVRSYFEEIVISDTSTIYDFLVLALDENDLLASFNWDPLLCQAWGRNLKFAKDKLQRKLPMLVFLHGSVGIGYCEECETAGLRTFACPKCRKCLKPCPLLFREKGDDGVLRKDYDKNLFIKNGWDVFTDKMEKRGLLTIFGYSLPETDAEVRERLEKIWLLHKKQHTAWLRDVEVIDRKDEVYENWRDFCLPSKDSEGVERYGETNRIKRVCGFKDEACDFEKPFIARYPMWISEAWRRMQIDGDWGCDPIEDPLKIGVPLSEFHQWFEELLRSQNK